jgi:cell division protein FtsN
MTKSLLPFITVVLVLGLSLTSCKSKQKITEITGANKPATTTTVTVTPKTTTPASTTATTPVAEVTRSESFKLANGETNTSALSYKYHVVVGSFSVKENAFNLKSRLVSEGNNALTVENENGMLRVIIASFNDYAVAHQKIDQIRGSYPDAWVLVQK